MLDTLIRPDIFMKNAKVVKYQHDENWYECTFDTDFNYALSSTPSGHSAIIIVYSKDHKIEAIFKTDDKRKTVAKISTRKNGGLTYTFDESYPLYSLLLNERGIGIVIDHSGIKSKVLSAENKIRVNKTIEAGAHPVDILIPLVNEFNESLKGVNQLQGEYISKYFEDDVDVNLVF